MKQQFLVRWMPVLGLLALTLFACNDGEKKQSPNHPLLLKPILPVIKK